jgi:myo-inositol 2-dehydrogenase / D-chiro-inositol 1-dehydrogenase
MTLSVGVIGLGVMGAEHLRLLREDTAGVQVTAICDFDVGKAERLAQGAEVFADPMAVILSGKVDAVVIASPDATHAELALACLAAGKPALCEKPLATNADEALRVVKAEVALGRRLLQIGYMRRFDPVYVEMKRSFDEGGIGAPVLLHNVHRNAAAPDWFTGPMAVTNSFVHEIDISRWLLEAELVSATVHAAPGGDPLLITMVTDKGVIISTEVFMNANYGYHVHAQLVGRLGTVQMAQPTVSLTNSGLHHGHAYPENWVPRFREAYRVQMKAWVQSATTGLPAGASAWDGYAATAVAEQIVSALQTGSTVKLALCTRPALYA